MKKRSMKKWIPKNTSYCGQCPWYKFIKTIKLNESNCEHVGTCDEGCWTSPETCCYVNVYKCEYLGYTDWKEDSLLWDGVKECGVSDW